MNGATGGAGAEVDTLKLAGIPEGGWVAIDLAEVAAAIAVARNIPQQRRSAPAGG